MWFLFRPLLRFPLCKKPSVPTSPPGHSQNIDNVIICLHSNSSPSSPPFQSRKKPLRYAPAAHTYVWASAHRVPDAPISLSAGANTEYAWFHDRASIWSVWPDCAQFLAASSNIPSSNSTVPIPRPKVMPSLGRKSYGGGYIRAFWGFSDTADCACLCHQMYCSSSIRQTFTYVLKHAPLMRFWGINHRHSMYPGPSQAWFGIVSLLYLSRVRCLTRGISLVVLKGPITLKLYINVVVLLLFCFIFFFFNYPPFRVTPAACARPGSMGWQRMLGQL